MELTRRDAVTALTAAGITTTAGCAGLTGETGSDAEPMEVLVSLADVLYPSDIEPTPEFIETFMYGRITDEESYREELTAGIETLNQLAADEQGGAFHTLSADQRRSVIENTDLRTGPSEPDGSDVARVNYYLLDELLFAFYSSPTGGELIGNTNPRGFPGGFGYSPSLEQ
ncbi:gluconate 2-dehydrogenase subunit 3 family protein [Halonotius terrestris]|uniref:Gluconate 2-dehydrogenase subunit 3 family protein n=1 Tax=Halonotius terrestris TaxID=2487750 RepID=A0A8J8TCR5_9EURY|nr:gluconate 2-dehydrogenase subunit 3 family protein [Halonotius terrestris]TQQ83590.1 gluconate 2-dehydrogenase subunit 3 family protein [Halonotius terrestris]